MVYRELKKRGQVSCKWVREWAMKIDKHEGYPSSSGLLFMMGENRNKGNNEGILIILCQLNDTVMII